MHKLRPLPIPGKCVKSVSNTLGFEINGGENSFLGWRGRELGIFIWWFAGNPAGEWS